MWNVTGPYFFTACLKERHHILVTSSFWVWKFSGQEKENGDGLDLLEVTGPQSLHLYRWGFESLQMTHI